MNEAPPYVEAVHEIYRGEATGVGRPGLDGHRPALPQTATFCRPLAAPALPGPLVQNGTVVKVMTLESWLRRSTCRRALYRDGPVVQRFRRDRRRRRLPPRRERLRQVLPDPTAKLNPSLHVIDQAPFYAVKIVPGDPGPRAASSPTSARVVRAGRAGGRRAVRRRQPLRGRDGSHLRGPWGHHRPCPDLRLPCGRDDRRGGSRGPRATLAARPPATGRPPDAHRPRRRDRRRASAPRLQLVRQRRASTTFAIGATDLSYTRSRDPSLQVLLSFGVVAPTFHVTDPPPLDLPGCDINLAQVVHGSQSIGSTHRSRPPARPRCRSASARSGTRARPRSSGGGRHLPTGERFWTTRSSIFVRGEGGWAATVVSSTPVEPSPTASPTSTRRTTSPPSRPLLCPPLRRPQPLHADPGLRRDGRLPAPILHGLCPYGYCAAHRPTGPRRRRRGSPASA